MRTFGNGVGDGGETATGTNKVPKGAQALKPMIDHMRTALAPERLQRLGVIKNGKPKPNRSTVFDPDGEGTTT